MNIHLHRSPEALLRSTREGLDILELKVLKIRLEILKKYRVFTFVFAKVSIDIVGELHVIII